MRASDSTLKISSNADLAALQIEYADSPTNPNSPDFDPNADPEQLALEDQQKFQQQLQGAQELDKSSNSGDITQPTKTSNMAGAQVQGLKTDAVMSVSGDHALAALNSIQSKTLDSPTQRVAGLANLNIREFDNAKRA